MWWWMILVTVLALVGAGVVIFRKSRAQQEVKVVANAERLMALPSYQKAVRNAKTWLSVGLIAAIVGIFSLGIAAARPQDSSANAPENRNRDIMLCLDVSGSMLRVDKQIAAVFAELAKKFKGERIGLTIFDSSAVQAFPLTDDYEFVAEQLKRAYDALDINTNDFAFFEGTYEAKGASLIGDGLASCVQAFPKEDGKNRSRSIILATDNHLAGAPLFSVGEAAELATEANIRVYALDPARTSYSSKYADAAQELEDAAKSTKGGYYQLDAVSYGSSQKKIVDDVVKRIQETEASLIKGPAKKTTLDMPQGPLIFALLAAVVLTFSMWRARA